MKGLPQSEAALLFIKFWKAQYLSTSVPQNL